ncbi:MAG: TetR/AcrR family transcriptional regulator [Paludibacteraceae bacterium]|jgi:AcrR family transcriptional regulator|nr:TetR/AcrR family transcriptional regulator [Paludibacteraceae bacterium]
MVKDRKELIIYKALELYLINGYENVSITDLQSALDMGRGTMYYHFKNKDEIYVEIVNRFFLRPKQEMLRLKEDIRVPDMIEALLRYFKFLEESLMELEQRNINTSNVIMLLYSAYHRFPELYRRAHRLYATEQSMWLRAIRNSMIDGDVRRDLPLEETAALFTQIKDGYDAGRSGMQMDFNMVRKQYQLLYSLIRTSKTDK